jgi:hypothetical protein
MKTKILSMSSQNSPIENKLAVAKTVLRQAEMKVVEMKKVEMKQRKHNV